jgi:hypothetical protein
VGFLKEKTGYRPTPAEVRLAWVFTAAAGIAVAAWLWTSCAP